MILITNTLYDVRVGRQAAESMRALAWPASASARDRAFDTARAAGASPYSLSLTATAREKHCELEPDGDAGLPDSTRRATPAGWHAGKSVGNLSGPGSLPPQPADASSSTLVGGGRRLIRTWRVGVVCRQEVLECFSPLSRIEPEIKLVDTTTYQYLCSERARVISSYWYHHQSVSFL